MNIFDAIRKDHDIQRSLAEKLIKTEGDTKIRRDLWKALKHELAIHADAEERYFYVPLIKKDMTQEHARHGVAEHHEMDELVEELEKTDMSSAGWLVTAKKLKEKVFHHLEDEEHTFFQLAGKVLSESEKSDLQNQYRKHMSDENAGIEA